MTHSITLQWVKLGLFDDLIKEKQLRTTLDQPGVYLWVETIDDVDCVTYVGKSETSVSARLIDHFRNFIGGRYSIPFYIRSGNSGSAKESWIFDLDKEEVVRTVVDKDKFIEIIKDGYKYMKSINLYYCILQKEITSPKLVERKLLFNIKPLYTKRGTKTDPDSNLQVVHSGDLAMTELQQMIENNSLIYKKYKEKNYFKAVK